MDRERRRSDERTWQDEIPPKLYSILKGTVASVQPYGAFVRFPGRKKNGLVHRSQISKVPVEKVEEVLEVGEEVKVKIISNEEGKIALSMKVVNQSTGEDLDPNHVQTSLDEQRRRTGVKRDTPRIELGAVLNTTCKKCGGKGHFAQDCFQRPGSSASYDLLPDIDHMMDQEREKSGQGVGHSSSASKKKKKEKKHKKKHKRKSAGSDSEDEPKVKKHKKHHKKHKGRKESTNSSSDSASSEDERHRHKSDRKHKSRR